jgi:SAM-dependent methyltransferase
VLYDLPNVVSGAEALRVPDIAGRCEIVGGDFFESVPAEGDAYILSRVIHDWDDDAALKILRNCQRAIRPDGRLLLVEGVSKPPNEPDPNKFLDVWFIGGRPAGPAPSLRVVPPDKIKELENWKRLIGGAPQFSRSTGTRPNFALERTRFARCSPRRYAA